MIRYSAAEVPPFAMHVPDVKPGNPWQAENTRQEVFYLEPDGFLHHWTSSVARQARKAFDNIFQGHLFRRRIADAMWAARDKAALVRACRERGLKFSHRLRRQVTQESVAELARIIVRRARGWAEFTVPDVHEEHLA